MADLQPQVPEQVERCLDDLLGPAGRLPRGDERDVDVRMERHLAPSIAADRHQRETLPRRRIGDGIEMFGREVIGEADDLVGEKGVGGGGLAALPGFFLQPRSEEHTSELQSLMRLSYAVFCLKKKTQT